MDVPMLNDSRCRLGVPLALTLACLAYLASMSARAQQPAPTPAPGDATAWPALATAAPAAPAPQATWTVPTTQTGNTPPVVRTAQTAQSPQQAMQVAQATPTAQAAQPRPASPEPVEEEQTSTEQGQTHLDESFGPRSHDEWVRETRRKAWADTDWNIQLRTYYLDRDKYDDSKSEAWAIGGSAGFKTGYFRDIFSLGATLYTSQKLHGPDDKDGTLLLQPGQDGYTVLGELYGEFEFTEDIHGTLGARGLDTPYINRNDSRMTPNTFLAALVQGQHGNGTDESQWRWGAGYVDKIKERNSDKFVSMSDDAGAPDDVDRGVYTVGGNYKLGELSIGAIDYYSNDIINIFYTEGKYGFPIGESLKLRMALQYTDQQSVGDELLRGTDFSAHQWGAKTELAFGGALATVAYTSAGGDTNMQAPWSGYPGYTSVQVEDFNRAGEDAWLARLGYTPKMVPGLSMYALYVSGSTPDDPGQFSRDETDFNVQWSPPEGVLKGLLVRLRYAKVDQDNDTDLSDLRVMVFYDVQM
jgi:hypothetical protein